MTESIIQRTGGHRVERLATESSSKFGMGSIEFKTSGLDDDGMLEFRVVVAGNGHACTHKAYLHPEDLLAFGAALQSYPFGETKEAVLEAGSPDPGWYGYMRLRAFLLSGFGRSVLEVQYETRGELPECASGTFYIPGETAAFSRLGEEICKFVPADDEVMRNEWLEGAYVTDDGDWNRRSHTKTSR